MARDIEEFLRRAAERRKQSQSGGTAPPPRKSAPPRAPQAPPKQRLAQEQVLRPDEIDPYARKKSQAEAEPKPQAAPKRPSKPPQQKKRETISEQVKRTIDVSDVTEHANQLGAQVGQADERLEARLEKFDHSMGALDGTATVTDDETAKVEGPDRSQLAIDLLQLFSQPKSIRQSILISEVLKRPAFFDDDDDE